MGSLWNRSGTIERQDDDIRAAGALAYFFQGLTTTPLTVYTDAAESEAHPNPVVADAKGRWPDVFVPYITGYDVQVKTEDGVQLSYTQNIPNPDPIDLSVTIPAESQVQTGMIHGELVNATKAGYVRLNGRTLGNAVSGATERANADTSDLFVYLWNNVIDAIATVSTGRGASAASDYAANKTIVLPDARGRALIGLDDMGASSANVITGAAFSPGNPNQPGARGGAATKALAITNLPAHTHTGTTVANGSHNHGGVTGGESVSHTHSGTTGTQSANHTHSGTTDTSGSHSHTVGLDGNTLGGNPVPPTAGSASITTTETTSTDGSHTHTFTTGNNSGDHTHNFTSGANSVGHTHTISSDGSHSHTFTTDSAGSGTAFEILSPVVTVTWFIKL